MESKRPQEEGEAVKQNRISTRSVEPNFSTRVLLSTGPRASCAPQAVPADIRQKPRTFLWGFCRLLVRLSP
jgi:hypothetical protein